MPRLTEPRVLRETLPPKGKLKWLRCSEVKGFCACITPNGARTWYVLVREKTGKQKPYSLGPVGVLPFEGPPEEPGARDLALAALNAARRGDDVALAINLKKEPAGLTLNEIWKAHKEAGFPKVRGTGRKGPRTIKADSDRWALYVEKEFGKKPVSEIDNAAVLRWLDKIAKKGQRAQCLTLVKSMLSFAAKRGLATVHEISEKPSKPNKINNYYTDAQLAAIDLTATEMGAESEDRLPYFAAVRLLLHTGARSEEIRAARWSQIRGNVLIRDHHKGGEDTKEILLTDEAVEIIKGLPRLRGCPWLFPAESKAGHIMNIESAWDDVCKRAGVPRYRPHDLRHSFASAFIRAGGSLAALQKLMGHADIQTTMRYVHVEQETQRLHLNRMAEARRAALKPAKSEKAA